MPRIDAAYLAHQRKRWMRPNAHLFIRPDWRRFVRPGDRDSHPFALYERKYRPDQLRDEIGRWADEGGGGGRRTEGVAKPSGINDPRVISDAAPDPVRPGEQYAQNRSPAPVTAVAINGNWVAPTPGQAARLTVVEAQARDAIRRVQELDPRWKPQAELYNTVEGYIAARQNDLLQAQDRARELQDQGIGPGRYAVESIPTRGSGRSRTPSDIEKINEIGNKFGCHTCGTDNPGTASGNYILDHQPPLGFYWFNGVRVRYPHCASCSGGQAGKVWGLMRRQRNAE